MRPSSATAAPRGSGFGARLREARERAGLSQSQLGEKIGKTKDSVSQWEREIMGVSWETLRAIADTLNVDEYWLRDGQELEHRSAAGHDFAIIRDGVELLLVEVKANRQQASAIERRLARLEEAVVLILGEAHFTAGDDQAGDELVTATRRAKALLAEELDAEGDAPASEAAPDTRGEGDATPEAPRARRAGTRRTAGKPAR